MWSPTPATRGPQHLCCPSCTRHGRAGFASATWHRHDRAVRRIRAGMLLAALLTVAALAAVGLVLR